MNKFLDSRKGDIRTNAVKAINDLKSGSIFYITCIDEPQSYAVQNAHEDLKRIATGVISSNDDDGVARWLSENYVMV